MDVVARDKELGEREGEERGRQANQFITLYIQLTKIPGHIQYMYIQSILTHYKCLYVYMMFLLGNLVKLTCGLVVKHSIQNTMFTI